MVFSLIYFPSLTSNLLFKIFSSVPLLSCHQEIWRQSSREFEPLRPFLVFHRLFQVIYHFSVIKKFA